MISLNPKSAYPTVYLGGREDESYLSFHILVREETQPLCV